MIPNQGTTFEPLVSIVIPVYNGANYLESAIKSALNQSYRNIEIIVINDGSTDGGATEKIAKKFGNQIRYFHQANGGCGAALNCGISQMQGEYFSWLSHDDLYTPDKVADQIALLDRLANKNSIIFSAYELIDENDIHKAFVYPDIALPSEKLAQPLMPLLRGLIHGCTLLIPKKLFDEIGIFDIFKRTTQDYDLWFKILRKAPLKYVPKPLIQSRIHPEQDTQKINALHLEECNDLWSSFLERLTLDEMIALDGSRVKFLANMADHLATTPYKLAYKKANDDMLQIVVKTSASILLLVEDISDSLTQSLDSIALQSHTNLEILLVYPTSLELQNLATSGMSIRYYSYTDDFCKNTVIAHAISQSNSDLVAFLKAGDVFKEEKIFEQTKWMLSKDVDISVTAFGLMNNQPFFLSDQASPCFQHNEFPTLLLQLDEYFSTIMMKKSSIRSLSLATIQKNSGLNILPLWCNIFTFCVPSYLDKSLTIKGNQSIQNLSQLQKVLLNKILRLALVNSEEFLQTTKLNDRAKIESGSVMKDLIHHQLKTYQAYEGGVLGFWGRKRPDYKNISIREQLGSIWIILKLIRDTYYYRLHREILWFQRASLADYEGLLVRIIKLIMPQFIWRHIKTLYLKTKKLFTPSK